MWIYLKDKTGFLNQDFLIVIKYNGKKGYSYQ